MKFVVKVKNDDQLFHQVRTKKTYKSLMQPKNMTREIREVAVTNHFSPHVTSGKMDASV